MVDQLIIHDNKTSADVGTYDYFGASLKERRVNAPKKKSIKETVPFSNEIYDFSSINGEVYWEASELEYVFEILEDTPELLEEKKMLFKAFIMNIEKSKIYDPFIKSYHFRGTFEDIDFDDSEIEKSTITVKFSAYPYMIANEKKVYAAEVTTVTATVLELVNNSSHCIVPTFKSNVPIILTIGNNSYNVPAGEITDETIIIPSGPTPITIKAANINGSLTIEFSEEVL